MNIHLFIVIPVYNAETYIVECLESILTQEYKNYEIIIVDDGSTDSSGDICDLYAEKYNLITVIHKANGGQLSARRAAVDYIKTNRNTDDTYSIFVDSDDMLKQRALQTIVKYVGETQSDLIIYGYETFNKYRVTYESTIAVNRREIIDDMSELFRKALIEHNFNSMCRKAVKTEILLDGDFESIIHIQMGEDLIQSLAIYQRCKNTLIVPDILYRYRENENSISRIFRIKKYTDDITAREYAINLIRNKKMWNEEDFEKYRQNCLDSLLIDIKHILVTIKDRKQIIACFNEIAMHPFFGDFYSGGITKKSNILLKLFLRKRFKTIILLGHINNIKNRCCGRRVD